MSDIFNPGRTFCRCACGYKCGGPGKCKVFATDIQKCLDEHFVKDCAHDFTGPEWVSSDGLGASATCRRCGMLAISHDMAFGP